MAINKWINITINPNAASIPDRTDHRHSAVFGTADGATVTVAYDSAIITSRTLLKSCVDVALQQAAQQISTL